MSKKKKSETNGADGQQAMAVSELKLAAMQECKGWVEQITDVIHRTENELDKLQGIIHVVLEARLTWLERACGVMDIDVRRGVFGGAVGLYWADVDGNIVMTEDDPNKPEFELVSIDDVMSLTIPSDAADRVARVKAKMEEAQKEAK